MKNIKNIEFCIVVISMISIRAATTVLWQHSSGTYVQSTHGDAWNADTYDGLL